MLEHQNYFVSEHLALCFLLHVLMSWGCVWFTQYVPVLKTNMPWIIRSDWLAHTCVIILCIHFIAWKWPAKIDLDHTKQPTKFGIFCECYFEPWQVRIFTPPPPSPTGGVVKSKHFYSISHTKEPLPYLCGTMGVLFFLTGFFWLYVLRKNK